MKRRIALFVAAVITVAGLGVNTFSSEGKLPNRIEVSLENVFVASKGYDENDLVEITLDGYLKNLCYEVDEVNVKKIDVNNEFQINVFASRRNLVECQEDKEKIPDYLKWETRYTQVKNVGKLKPGTYSVVFKQRNSETRTTSRGSVKFEVVEADKKTTDDELYAPITNVFVPELVDHKTPVDVVLTGALETDCLRMKSIKHQRLGNVIIIVPKLEEVTGLDCSKKNLKKIGGVVNVGYLSPGRYLVHTRSMGGHSLNRTFTVHLKTGSPTGGHGGEFH